MKATKRIISVVLILVIVLLFAITWWHHPELSQQLRHISILELAGILLMYATMTALLVLIYDITLRLAGYSMPLFEQALLTMYSSIVNFFGPLQSGPGVRTVYLKKRHHVSIKKYLAATTVYYLFFAWFSGLFLLSGLTAGWLFLFLAGSVIIALLLWKYRSRFKDYKLIQNYSLPNMIQMACTALIQVVLVCTIYYIELHSVGAHASIRQVAVYTGAANFSLFVSLTPGALGFREAFLLFSTRLHHISGTTIVSANILDRGAYVIFLAILFAIVLILRAKDRFDITSDQVARSADER